VVQKVTSKEAPTQCVQNVRNNYRDILKNDVTGANEITIMAPPTYNARKEKNRRERILAASGFGTQS
jgi:hypothetical protein